MGIRSLLVKSIGSFVLFFGLGAMAQDIPIVQPGAPGAKVKRPWEQQAEGYTVNHAMAQGGGEAERLGSLTDVEIEEHIVEGRASDVIAQVAERTRAGVVVMGTLARAGLPGLIIGNTAERLLSYLDASIIAVKPPGFTSPVKLS